MNFILNVSSSGSNQTDAELASPIKKSDAVLNDL